MVKSSTPIALFQSYQFRQINPDESKGLLNCIKKSVFQSYQFRQINPDLFFSLIFFIYRKWVSIVSIQADQSRQLPLGSQSWRGSQRLNGGTYFFNRKMIKIYTVNLYKI